MATLHPSRVEILSIPGHGWVMRHALVLPIALLTLIACERKTPDQPAPDAPEATPPTVNATRPAPAPGTTLPKSDANLRFIGKWAADAKACASPPWNFTERDLTTKGHVYCAFDRINPVPGGYDIAVTCQSEGDETKEQMRLRFAESAKAMTVESDVTYKQIPLVWCGA
jgi:hypothetical protein